MSFKIVRGAIGSLAMFTATRNASSRDMRFMTFAAAAHLRNRVPASAASELAGREAGDALSIKKHLKPRTVCDADRVS